MSCPQEFWQVDIKYKESLSLCVKSAMKSDLYADNFPSCLKSVISLQKSHID